MEYRADTDILPGVTLWPVPVYLDLDRELELEEREEERDREEPERLLSFLASFLSSSSSLGIKSYFERSPSSSSSSSSWEKKSPFIYFNQIISGFLIYFLI